MRRVQKPIVILILLCTVVMLTGCSILMPDCELQDVYLSEAKMSVFSAFYLSKKGTLYCTGVNKDASGYVLYEDKDQYVVAENVKEFGEILSGGYYIDNNNGLYIWNKQDLSMYNYKEGSHKKILDNVKTVIEAADDMLLYIDVRNDLYFLGELGGSYYDVRSPKLIAHNVQTAAFVVGKFGRILWSQYDGTLGSYEQTEDVNLDYIRNTLPTGTFTEICYARDGLLLLSDDDLWFYGNKDNLLKHEQDVLDSERTLTLIKSDIQQVSVTWDTFMALGTNGAVYLWGKFLRHGSNDIDKLQYKVYEGAEIAQEAKSIYAADSCISYVTVDGKCYTFHDDGVPQWYGNTSRNKHIGIDDTPITWE